MRDAERQYLRNVAAKQLRHLRVIARALGMTVNELRDHFGSACAPRPPTKPPRRHRWTSDEAREATRKANLAMGRRVLK